MGLYRTVGSTCRVTVVRIWGGSPVVASGSLRLSGVLELREGVRVVIVAVLRTHPQGVLQETRAWEEPGKAYQDSVVRATVRLHWHVVIQCLVVST